MSRVSPAPKVTATSGGIRGSSRQGCGGRWVTGVGRRRQRLARRVMAALLAMWSCLEASHRFPPQVQVRLVVYFMTPGNSRPALGRTAPWLQVHLLAALAPQ